MCDEGARRGSAAPFQRAVRALACNALSLPVERFSFGRALTIATLTALLAGVAAGTLDGSTGLRTVQHIWDSQRADWESDDGLPRVPRGT